MAGRRTRIGRRNPRRVARNAGLSRGLCRNARSPSARPAKRRHATRHRETSLHDRRLVRPTNRRNARHKRTRASRRPRRQPHRAGPRLRRATRIAAAATRAAVAGWAVPRCPRRRAHRLCRVRRPCPARPPPRGCPELILGRERYFTSAHTASVWVAGSTLGSTWRITPPSSNT